MTRFVALVWALVLVTFPLRATALDPAILLSLKLGWLALFVTGLLWPAWRAPLLLTVIPLVPWMPFEIDGVPHGVVHLVALSQALPQLIRPSISEGPRHSGVGSCWLLLLGVALTSLVVQYAGYALVFNSTGSWLGELGTHLSTYPLGRPGPALENMLAATMAFATGAMAFGVVRTSPLPRVRILQWLAAAVAAVALFGLWQAYIGSGLRPEWRINDPYITRINATYGDPNALAALLAAASPLLFVLAGQATGRARSWWAIAGVIVIAALVMTAGRIATIAACVGLCVAAALVIHAGLDLVDPSPFVRRLFRRIAFAACALGIATVLALTLAGTTLDARHASQRSVPRYVALHIQPSPAAQRDREGTARHLAGGVADDRGSARIWRRDRPDLPRVRYYAKDLPDIPPGMAFSAHNTFLNVGAELGVLGLAAWALLLGVSFAEGLARIRQTDAPAARRWVDAGLLGMVAAMTVAMTTGDRAILYEDLVLLGAITGAIAAGRAATPAAALQGRRVVHYAVAALVCVLVGSLPWRVLAERRTVRLDSVTSGFHAAELSPHGTPFRWSTNHAMFYLPPAATSVTLRLRSLAPFPQQVEVLVHGTPVFRSELSRGSGAEIRPLLPPKPAGGYQRIEIRVNPTWRPPGDGRDLGVMVDWEWR